ncbi:ubiquinol-cytochrome-c reductase complex assembly factor 1-like [Antedon mediterranea]|uniref:ubiquinol-cytochrome-c reductase complex assembly factor 1-like n=1 Tax=Antedon mediterranea TaxID=105859 RepID=UPI003AF4E1BA
MVLTIIFKGLLLNTRITVRNFGSNYHSYSNVLREALCCSKCTNRRIAVLPISTRLVSVWQNHIARNDLHTESDAKQALVRRTAESILHSEPTFLMRLKDRFSYLSRLRFNRFKMRVAGLNMYSSCVDGVDFVNFFKACKMSDTLFSWFLVTQLHVWMCMVRLRQEGREGKYLTHYLILSMWTDIAERGRVMNIPTSKMRAATSKMVEQFHGVLLAYDEGVMSDDRVLAGALWRNIFLQRCDDPESLANMVEYVRMQIQYLETLDSSQLLQKGRIKWLPFKANTSHLEGDLPKALSLDEELLGPDPNVIDKVPT